MSERSALEICDDVLPAMESEIKLLQERARDYAERAGTLLVKVAEFRSARNALERNAVTDITSDRPGAAR